MQKNNNLSGFTVIELLVVIVIIGLLLTAATLGFTQTRVTARDVEREQDIESLATQLELFYDNRRGTYPSQAAVINLDPAFRSGLDPNALFAPGVAVTASGSNSSIRAATTTAETPTTILPRPGQGNDIYVYQAFKRDGSLCSTTSTALVNYCVRFNLYYWNEASDEVIRVMSRNQ